MPAIHRLYERMRGIDDESIDHAMASALATAEPRAARFLALLLLERGHPQATRALISSFDRLPADVQSTVVQHANDLYRPLREAACEKSSGAPVHALRIIRRSGSTRLAYLVAEQLRHGGAELRAEAAGCLLEMARAVAGARSVGGNGGDAVSAGYLLAAVQEAVVQYRAHSQRPVLAAFAALLPRPMAQVNKALTDWQHAALGPLRQMLAAGEAAEFRRALLVLAAQDAVADAVLEGMGRALDQGQAQDVLKHWHMLLLPAVRGAVAKLTKVKHGYLLGEATANWPDHRAAGLPAWIMALPLTLPQRLEALGHLAGHRSNSARLGAILRLIQMADEAEREDPANLRRTAATAHHGTTWAINAAIERFTGDGEAAIARIAVRHLVRCKWPTLPKLLVLLVNGPQEEIRQLAGNYLAPMGFARYWERWPRLDQAQRIAAGRALIKLDPCFHSHLSQRLAGGDRDACVRAMNMIRDLNQGAFFQPALMALAGSDDAHLVSSAITALGSADSEDAIQIVEKSLEHRDGRVRASGIEALQQLRSTRHVDRLTAMALSEDNRPRANAIGHLLELSSGQAMHALRLMLEDERPEHRISALWLIDAAGLIEVMRHVAELSISDPDEEVKYRACRVIQRLIVAMQPAASETTGAAKAPSAALANLQRSA